MPTPMLKVREEDANEDSNVEDEDDDEGETHVDDQAGFNRLLDNQEVLEF